MDTLVEKATEMGVASIQPLLTSRSVLRLSGERAARKVAHWQAIAVAACEQSGRNRVPLIHPVMTLSDWLTKGLTVDAAAQRWVLDPREAVPLWPIQPSASATATSADASHPSAIVLSGPEGGLSAEELALARTPGGFTAVSLGARVLRADTAPLAALVMLTLPR
jgi:16S rRNA (uracil1498-N3)-methyltransferase